LKPGTLAGWVVGWAAVAARAEEAEEDGSSREGPLITLALGVFICVIGAIWG
jgi:hypothetical protein